MQKPKQRNVLAIGVTRDEFQAVVPFLDRDTFEVDRFPSASGALELVSRVPFEMLLVRYPLPDMPLDSFLDSVRDEESACLRSSLLLLTPESHDGEAKRYIGRGANRTISLEAGADAIQASISSLLNVAPRKAARFLARVEIKLGEASDMILCQTENLSATGMLIRTDKRYDLGTEIDFEFSLPNDVRPVRGIAEIVRHTMIGRDQVGGIGLRFLSFSGDSQRRFESYLRRL
ncbi:MAG: PilZ domain-containing protein [Acidobacteriota bacterium]